MASIFSRWRPHLQLILDPSTVDDVRARVEAAVAGGVDSIQIREKGARAEATAERAHAVIDAAGGSERRVLVLVNNCLDAALVAGADGIHLPEASLTPRAARTCRRLANNPRFVAGRSVHSRESLRIRGIEHLNYLLFGHVYSSASKPGIPPRGLEELATVVKAAPVPVLAVGGVTVEGVSQVIRAGATGVAVISAIAKANDPYRATLQLRNALDQCGVREHANVERGCSLADPG